jgi:hypothetical protein
MRDPMEVFEDILKRFPKLYGPYMKYNFCKLHYADGTEKPESKLYNAFYYTFYMECPCCATIRGLLAGTIFGLFLGWLLL